MIERFVIYVDWYTLNIKWHERVEFKDCLKNVPNDSSVALCCYSHKNFSIRGQGIGQVFFYMKSLKDKQNVPPDNTSKQSTIKFKEVDPTNESGSSGKELSELKQLKKKGKKSNCKLILCYVKELW